MVAIINKALMMWLGRRRDQIRSHHDNAPLVQLEQLKDLIRQGAGTQWGQKHNYETDMSSQQFQDRTPLSSYEQIYPWIGRSLQGEPNVLWPGVITKFAKSSGTTNARSKYIPMTDECLKRGHYRGGKDMWIIYLGQYPEAGAHLGKSVGIGGSLDEAPRPGMQVGDLSAVMMANLPRWAQSRRAPKLDVAMMPNWDEKLAVMAKALQNTNVRSLAGVPTWTLLLIQEVIKEARADSIFDVWPDLEVFFHGAVAFDPYRSVFAELLGPKMRYLELYNASEGFFAIQDDPDRPNEMLLMLDYGIFYEFIPTHDENQVLTIGEVEVGVPYELIITTNGGLWRYRLGDVVEFTSVQPYRLKIGGRTKHFINAFGEELMVGNAEVAMAKACEATGAMVSEYSAGPAYMGEGGQSGYHEWVIEFRQEPNDLGAFGRVLDQVLQEQNSDYASKRRGDLALSMPQVNVVPAGTFRRFLEQRGPITGRNKVPRLANHRDFIEQLRS